MVKFWIKQLEIIKKNSWIDFDKIILDIFDGQFQNYDVKLLKWYKNLYRLRIWTYRIIFKNEKNNIKVLFIWKRWDVYKWLKKTNLR